MDKWNFLLCKNLFPILNPLVFLWIDKYLVFTSSFHLFKFFSILISSYQSSQKFSNSHKSLPILPNPLQSLLIFTIFSYSFSLLLKSCQLFLILTNFFHSLPIFPQIPTFTNPSQFFPFPNLYLLTKRIDSKENIGVMPVCGPSFQLRMSYRRTYQ